MGGWLARVIADADARTWLVAVYGALVSTAALVWNVARQWRDTGRLAVRLEVITHYDRTPGMKVTISNVGRRPITASKIQGWEWAKGRWFPARKTTPVEFSPVIGRPLPAVLQPGHHVDVPVEAQEVGFYRGLFVLDHAEKRWRVSPRRFRAACAAFDAANKPYEEAKRQAEDARRKELLREQLEWLKKTFIDEPGEPSPAGTGSEEK